MSKERYFSCLRKTAGIKLALLHEEVTDPSSMPSFNVMAPFLLWIQYSWSECRRPDEERGECKVFPWCMVTRLCSSCWPPPQTKPMKYFFCKGHKGVVQSSSVQCTQIRKPCPKCKIKDYRWEKNYNPIETGTIARTVLLRMVLVIRCLIEYIFGNRLAIPFHSLLFPIPQVSLKASSKVTLFMNFSSWNALLRIAILLQCDLV